MQNDLKKSRKTLVITLVLFILPVMLATTLYMTGWRPAGQVNNGELIIPAKPLADREFKSIDGKSVKVSDLHGKWTMVYFDSSACPKECVDQLFFMRQIHVSQGKNLDRIQRVFVLTDTDSIDSLKTKLVDYPEMQVLQADKSTVTSMLKEFGNDDGISHGNIYFVDHLGNLMMKYKHGVEPAGMRKDLERLLKYSGESK